MSDLARRATEAARREREQRERAAAKAEAEKAQREQRQRTAMAEQADAALANVLGVRVGPSNWHERDLSGHVTNQDYGLVAEVEGVTVCWHHGRLKHTYFRQPQGLHRDDFNQWADVPVPAQEVTLGNFGEEMIKKRRKR